MEYLKEAQQRCEERLRPLFESATQQYGIVAETLESVCKTFPFSPKLTGDPIGIDERSRAAVSALKSARKAETAALGVLAEILDKMSG